jgi:8-oxo-dGTP diphosphatase
MVDVVLFTIVEGVLKLVLGLREEEPFANVYSLIGGKIEPDLDVNERAAALRIIQKKTGIISPYVEQLYTFGGRYRDQRRWSISIAHYALVPYEVIEPALGKRIKLVDADEDITLPFDHTAMVKMALGRIRSKSRYSSLPLHLMRDAFTYAELRAMYEIVLGEPQEKKKFQFHIEKMDILEKLEGAPKKSTGGAPAYLYRVKRDFQDRIAILERGSL